MLFIGERCDVMSYFIWSFVQLMSYHLHRPRPRDASEWAPPGTGKTVLAGAGKN